MPSVPLRCPKCSGPLYQCSEPAELFGIPLSEGKTCGAIYCPEDHWINNDNAKCALGKDACPASGS